MKASFLYIICFLFTLLLSCEKDPLLHPGSIPRGYSFFVAGHVYGKAGVESIGVHKPFKDNFAVIKEDNFIEFGVLTGDAVFSSTVKNWDRIDTDLAELKVPFHIAPGYHDLSDRSLFEARHGATYRSFIQNNDLFIILDPNTDQWNIVGDQLAFLEDVLNQDAKEVDNIFVFFHHLLWWSPDNKFRNVRSNSNLGRSEQTNFWNEVYPLFDDISNEVFMFSGDVGAHSGAAPFMYYNSDNVTFIASGMGGGVNDNFVIVDVGLDKRVSFKLIALNSNSIHSLGRLEDYVLP